MIFLLPLIIQLKLFNGLTVEATLITMKTIMISSQIKNERLKKI